MYVLYGLCPVVLIEPFLDQACVAYPAVLIRASLVSGRAKLIPHQLTGRTHHTAT